ncbi:MAG: bifunctional (p)ppGpp synthetase/guanosine-3',5'-bis(diphosphate) 3'-pyrophosphohydrolase [Oligoflexales bacterium]|nr:bifunctional (p)ppGpp synthetase/guanosine-3',5'-bis(diphosphate) 3'-pyrophosphohydrolase [Oligoflexales bacterium]
MDKKEEFENKDPLDTSTQPSNDATTPEIEYQELIENLEKFLPGYDRPAVDKAYHLALSRHSDQKRRSGELFVTHPIAVAKIVASIKLDLSSVIAAILHDIIEDTSCTLEEIEKEFGKEVSYLVDSLTKISKIEFRSNQEKLAENFRKMILAMSKDLRVILIKLCDRLHNMRTISSMPPEKIRLISQETLDIYAPLANRLGIYGIKSELEDHCLRQLKFDIYKEIRSKVAAKRSEREAYINDVKSILETELKKYGFKNIEVYGRPKHFFSIYKKMMDRHLDFEDIHDLFAFRIVVDNIKDCYEALGVVHAMWKPMPGRFKDYIAMPKANLYQSLHTTVVRPNGEPAEIQIRTREMHETCEFGVAAHWRYKEKSPKSLPNADHEKFSWLRQIVRWQNELKDPGEFLEAVKVDLFDEEIFVFTPRGDVLSLPQNATALDFAFAVHTHVGLKTVGVKINGRIAPIKKNLNSGDIVEIITSPNQKPSKDWLNFVQTSKARNKIRSYLRSEQREKSKILGKELLSQQLEKKGYTIESLEKSGDIEKLVKFGKESSFEDLLIAIGYGRINTADLIQKAFPPEEKKESISKQIEHSELPLTTDKTAKVKKPSLKGILVSGYEDVLVTFGRCCSPLPGEEIIGLITRGRGVSIHRSDCPRSLDLDPARRVQVSWTTDSSAETTTHRCHIQIVAQDKPGVLADVTKTLATCGANVVKAEAKISSSTLTGVLDFELGVKDLKQLEMVIQKLENLSHVISVTRRKLTNSRRLRKLGSI